MNDSGIYLIVNKVNKKFYIGSSLNVHRRFICHLHLLRKNKHHSRHLQNSFNKYGEDSFIFKKIVDLPNDQEIVLEVEQMFIDLFYDNCNEVYNIFDNVKGSIFSVDNQYTKRTSEEVRKRLSEVNSGDGYVHKEYKDEHMKKMRSKITVRMDGKKHKKESIDKMIKSRTGLKRSEETKKKMSLNNGNKKAVVINDVEYYSIMEASRFLGIPHTTINSRIKNEKFTNYNFK